MKKLIFSFLALCFMMAASYAGEQQDPHIKIDTLHVTVERIDGPLADEMMSLVQEFQGQSIYGEFNAEFHTFGCVFQDAGVGDPCEECNKSGKNNDGEPCQTCEEKYPKNPAPRWCMVDENSKGCSSPDKRQNPDCIRLNSRFGNLIHKIQPDKTGAAMGGIYDKTVYGGWCTKPDKGAECSFSTDTPNYDYMPK